MEFVESVLLLVTAALMLIKGVENECQAEWINLNNKCFWFSWSATSNSTKIFTNAISDCSQKNASLFPFSLKEEDFIIELAGEWEPSINFLNNGEKLWVRNLPGASSDDDENAGILPRCAYLIQTEGDLHTELTFGFDHCLQKYNYICEKSLDQTACPSCGTKSRKKRHSALSRPYRKLPLSIITSSERPPPRFIKPTKVFPIIRPHERHLTPPLWHPRFRHPFSYNPFSLDSLESRQFPQPWYRRLATFAPREVGGTTKASTSTTTSTVSSNRRSNLQESKGSESSVSPDREESCSEGDFEYGGACYYLEKKHRAWQEAADDCRSTKGGNLAYVHDIEEMEYVIAILNKTLATAPEMWTNLQHVDVRDKDKRNASNTDSPKWLCAANRYEEKSQTLVLDFQDCLNELPALCKYEKPGQSEVTALTNETGKSCHPGWLQVHGQCLRYFAETKSNLDAVNTCKEFGGDLLIINDHRLDYMRSLATVFHRFLNGSQPDVWIKNKLRTTGILLSFFKSGETLCDTLSIVPESIRLMSFPCNGKIYPFICQSTEVMPIASTEDETTPEMTTIPESTTVVVKSDIADDPTPFENEPCPDGSWKWLRFGDFCYKFYPSAHINQLRSWHRSHAACRDENSQLVSIHSSEENRWIQRQVRFFKDDFMWIGARHVGLVGFNWVDTTAFNYSNWDEGEPNNVEGVEDCVNIYTHIPGGPWNDLHCNSGAGYICKKSAFREKTTAAAIAEIKGGCPEKWSKMDDKCVRYFDAGNQHGITFFDASNKCHEQARGGSMVSIHSKSQFFFLYTLITTLKNVWIGLTYNIVREEFVWEDTTDVNYIRWGRNEPTMNGSAMNVFSPKFYEGCVQIKLDDEEQEPGFWHDVSCYNVAGGFFCQIPLDPDIPQTEVPFTKKCPPPFQEFFSFGKSCYQLKEKPATWEEAHEECIKKGAHLVSIRNQAELAYLWNQFKKSDIKDYWIALSNNNEKRSFIWTDGWPLLFDNWKIKLTLSIPSCASMDSKDGTWTSGNCLKVKPFICEYSEEKPYSKKSPIVGGCLSHSHDWIDFGGDFCYKAELSPKSWPDANHHCIHLGGYLVSVHSPQDMKNLQKIMDSVRVPLWIGATWRENGGFGWSDHSPFNFTRWRERYEDPDVQKIPKRRCVQLSVSGVWEDSQCSFHTRYVCQTSKEYFKSGTGTHDLTTTTEQNAEDSNSNFYSNLTTTTLQNAENSNSNFYSSNLTTTTEQNAEDSNSNFYSSHNSPESLSFSAVAGILILILLVVGTLCFMAVTLFRYRKRQANGLSAYGFDNVIYRPDNDAVLNNIVNTPEERECILETEEDCEDENESELSPKLFREKI